MEYAHLSDTVEIKVVEDNGEEGTFKIEGLYSGYGVTLGNSLRRVLLSSLPGAAATYIKIKGASHEFSTMKGIKEDLIDIMLNVKQLRFNMSTSEPQVLMISKKGEGKVTAADIESNAEVEVVNPKQDIATITDKKTTFEAEITVERGLGYSAVESRKSEKLPIGTIGVDAFFSPVLNVNYNVENMRVGDRTDYNRLTINITTDGSISPSDALHKCGNILKDHYQLVSELGGEYATEEEPGDDVQSEDDTENGNDEETDE